MIEVPLVVVDDQVFADATNVPGGLSSVSGDHLLVAVGDIELTDEGEADELGMFVGASDTDLKLQFRWALGWTGDMRSWANETCKSPRRRQMLARLKVRYTLNLKEGVMCLCRAAED
jgi:hypothetical protein